MIDEKDWKVLVDVETKIKGKVSPNLWGKYWNVVEKIGRQMDIERRKDEDFKKLVLPLLKEFYYEKNGREMTRDFLITMLYSII